MNKYSNDTIAAISTALGEGGIGIVRLSGPESFNIAQKVFKPQKKKSFEEFKNRTLYLGHIIEPESGEIIDEVLVSFFKGPYTYTREDMVEINCHGGLVAQRRILAVVLNQGAKIAEPGEFTKRAFLNGRIDLSQAEAVIDIIRAKTDRALLMANKQLSGGLSNKIKKIRSDLLNLIAHIEANIDFPEEDIPEAEPEYILNEIIKGRNMVKDLLESAGAGRILREGLSTLILGNTNVGKSSLLNTLLKDERAIVTDIPGTTRDVIEEYIDIKGIPIKIIDTAGIRQTSDEVEKIGIERAMKYLEDAELVLLMFDASRKLTDDDINLIKLVREKLTITIINKTDLPTSVDEEKLKHELSAEKIIKISALKEEGIEELKEAIYDTIYDKIGIMDEGLVAAGERQRIVLKEAYDSLDKALDSMRIGMPIEMVEVDIRDSWEKLGEITGDTVREDIIKTIFHNFCIGK